MLHFTEVLTRLDHIHYISGQELADINNVTRATIHNCIQKIDSLGIAVERVRGLGYRLAHPVELLDKKKIFSHLPSHIQQICSHIHYKEELDSTNKFASSLDLSSDKQFSAVFTEIQSAGKGRRGREWVSPYAANIYLSLLWPLQRPIHEAGVIEPNAGVESTSVPTSFRRT